MRALYVEALKDQDSYFFCASSLHHLINVARIQTFEDILLINGEGLFVFTSVEEISKKELKLKKKFSKIQLRQYRFSLALGIPKRDALELCLKQATELGFENIYLIKSQYSQIRCPDIERMKKLLISAIEQSNAPFMPKLFSCNWDEIPWEFYQDIWLLDSQSSLENERKSLASLKAESKELLIIGPEGGFSTEELSYFHSQNNLKPIRLPTPILRTATAVATGAGMMIQNLLNYEMD